MRYYYDPIVRTSVTSIGKIYSVEYYGKNGRKGVCNSATPLQALHNVRIMVESLNRTPWYLRKYYNLLTIINR
jgi:hypothetical protein